MSIVRADATAEQAALVGEKILPGEGRGLVIVAEQLAEFGGVERIIHTLMDHYPAARLVAGRFSTRPGSAPADFEARARELGIALGGHAGSRVRLVGPGGIRSHYLSPLYARRLSALALDGATTVLSLGGMGWTLGARVPAGARHVGYIGGPPRAFYGHVEQYLRLHSRRVRPLLRLAVPALRAHHRRLLLRPHRVVTNSQCSARGLAELIRRPVGVIHPPARTRFFTPADEPRKHFLAIARLFHHKRVDVLVDAFRRLPRERLVVAGDGPALAELRAAAPPNVTFTGHLADDGLLGLYRASRAVVTASVEEFGISNVEALAAGVPVIAPRAGGSGEIVEDGRTGVLFDRVEPDYVVAAVRRFARAEFDQAVCRRSAERFSEERFLAELEPVLRLSRATDG